MLDNPNHTTPPAPSPESAKVPDRRWPGWTWPDPASPIGAVTYAVLGGLIAWFLVDVLPHHVQVHVMWRW